MTLPKLAPDDLQRLQIAFPDLDFSDQERVDSLLESGTRDIHAAPGSGKTTLLAAKLVLLAEKWPHTRRGICVLSHTNVARDEIEHRLQRTPAGSQLLAYPHFIGTIQAFVDRFLGLPIVRSCGIKVELVDNDAFEGRAKALLHYKRNLKVWAEKGYNREDAICRMRYEGPELKLVADVPLPGEGTPTFKEATDLKQTLTNRGIFRFEDMYAFGAVLLTHQPGLRGRLSHRFPLVLLDEMQDTDWRQEALLEKCFDDTVVIQRFGDRNQRILNTDVDAEKLTFPRAGYLNIASSKRFGSAVAKAVSSVQVTGAPVIGNGNVPNVQPTLLLYDAARVEAVIPHFGELALNALSDDVLRSGPVKAVCFRRSPSTSKKPVGRYLGDYWPACTALAELGAQQESAFRLLADEPDARLAPCMLTTRARDVRRAVLLALRGAGSARARAARDFGGLLRALSESGLDVAPLQALCRDLALRRGGTSTAESWRESCNVLHRALNPYLDADISPGGFRALPSLRRPEAPPVTEHQGDVCVVETNGRAVRVQLGTIASVKGETHVATLVLESFGWNRKFDVETALPGLAELRRLGADEPENVKSQYRNLYVAMSRPSHYLCLAMNRVRATQEYAAAMQAAGWNVAEVR